MTELSIAPTRPDIYLTPRAAETALAAGIVAVRPNITGITAVRDFVNERVSNPGYRFPENVDELAFVMRWSGAGNRLITKWDTIFDKAKPETQYLHGWALAQASVDAARLDEPMPLSVRRADLSPATTVEVNIEDWDNPKFAERFASGVLFKWHGREQKSLVDRLAGDVFEAFDSESRARFGHAAAAGELDVTPAGLIQPFVALHNLQG